MLATLGFLPQAGIFAISSPRDSLWVRAPWDHDECYKCLLLFIPHRGFLDAG